MIYDIPKNVDENGVHAYTIPGHLKIPEFSFSLQDFCVIENMTLVGCNKAWHIENEV